LLQIAAAAAAARWMHGIRSGALVPYSVESWKKFGWRNWKSRKIYFAFLIESTKGIHFLLGTEDKATGA
jgi:hypothetical protein